MAAFSSEFSGESPETVGLGLEKPVHPPGKFESNIARGLSESPKLGR